MENVNVKEIEEHYEYGKKNYEYFFIFLGLGYVFSLGSVVLA